MASLNEPEPEAGAKLYNLTAKLLIVFEQNYQGKSFVKVENINKYKYCV